MEDTEVCQLFRHVGQLHMSLAKVLGLLNALSFSLHTVNLFIQVCSMLLQSMVSDELGLTLPIALLFCLCGQKGKAQGGPFEEVKDPQWERDDRVIDFVSISLYFSNLSGMAYTLAIKGDCLRV